MKILCLLVTCLNPQNRGSNNGDVRNKQYSDGLEKFFSYKHILDEHNVQICLTDNTCTELPSYINLPDGVITRLVNNNKGAINKGVGLIGQWLDCKDIIEQYDYVIHFEPRQLLVNFNFINNFLENPRDLFTHNHATRHFNTGLCALKSNFLIDYSTNCNLQHMYMRGISIETDLYNWYTNNNISHEILEKMNLIWYDGLKPVLF